MGDSCWGKIECGILKIIFMKTFWKVLPLLLILGACRKQLENINNNPNGADPSTTNPNLVLSTVLTATGQLYVTEGFGDIAGVMQHTQWDGHTGPHNNYDWS